MSHEQWCADNPDVPMDLLMEVCDCVLISRVRTAAYAEGYRDGFNDHARSRAYAEAVYGPYTKEDKWKYKA